MNTFKITITNPFYIHSFYILLTVWTPILFTKSFMYNIIYFKSFII